MRSACKLERAAHAGLTMMPEPARSCFFRRRHLLLLLHRRLCIVFPPAMKDARVILQAVSTPTAARASSLLSAMRPSRQWPCVSLLMSAKVACPGVLASSWKLPSRHLRPHPLRLSSFLCDLVTSSALPTGDLAWKRIVAGAPCRIAATRKRTTTLHASRTTSAKNTGQLGNAKSWHPMLDRHHHRPTTHRPSTTTMKRAA